MLGAGILVIFPLTGAAGGCGETSSYSSGERTEADERAQQKYREDYDAQRAQVKAEYDAALRQQEAARTQSIEESKARGDENESRFWTRNNSE